jgi:hypothetical protein
MNIELMIQHGNTLFQPAIEEGIVWSTERKGCPSTLTFNVLKKATLGFQEGDAVRMKVDGKEVFYGFIFSKKRDKEGIISVTAYDQLRYLKNKDTYVYENKTAGDLIKMIANDFNLKTGSLEATGHNIVSRVEDNQTLFDIIQTALDLTLQATGKMFVLYDDFGKLTLKSLGNMKKNVLIDADTGQNFDYTSSIDEQTYNKIKLVYENEETGKREVFIAQSGDNINNWGVLQHFDTLQKGENGANKANSLLKLYNAKTRRLSIKDAFGSVDVRAGVLIPVVMNLGDIEVGSYFLVEKCKHTFKSDEHFMDLTLRGGAEFIA